MLTTAAIKRKLFWDKESKTHSCFCFIETNDTILIMAAANSKHRALAANEAMTKAVYRFNCGPMNPDSENN